jgi:hypothetical protein
MHDDFPVKSVSPDQRETRFAGSILLGGSGSGNAGIYVWTLARLRPHASHARRVAEADDNDRLLKETQQMSIHRSSVPPERIEELREDFEAVDGDQDGRIDYGEFSVLMDGMDPDMGDALLRIGFREIDTDQDGRISLTEFVAWRTL